ncbi:hypothetical protein BKA70DRAFT_774315 [Coprinopsis sp. MPI-PUGE-AT-0042]|nr:hypothetical protein BKA70DRAFT_774315 [Coprinopsis sp. MPI-PUGE-AT-0042]
MSARFARSLFQAGARRAQTVAPRRAFGKRTMATEAHGASKSDTPWMVGSALVFGPLFLYLVSPSARKHTGAVHHDEKEYPTLKHEAPKAEAHEPVIMKDSEGTEQNVAGSLALSEKTDAPKAGDSSPSYEAAKEEAKTDTTTSTTESSDSGKDTSSSAPKSHKDSTPDFQEAGDTTPADQSAPRKAATDGTTPLEQAKEKGKENVHAGNKDAI